MLNSCNFTGRFTADPELRTTQNGVSVTGFSLAVQRNYKVDDEYPTDFLNFVAWRGTAEFICKHFHKGNLITVEGSLETRKYTDKDGNPRTAYEIKVDRAHFCESAGGRQNGNNNGNPPAAESVGGFTPVFPNTTAGFVESDDDLPF